MGTRLCIKCGQALERRAVHNVEVDCCPSCGGLWLDEGEINQISRDARLSAGELHDLERQLARTHGRADRPEPDVLRTPCPACGGKLTIGVFGPTHIELCSACRGMFLDRGELEKAIKLVERGEATTVVALVRSVYTSGVIE